nr:MAG TPA: hypothetical protein [Caudoviricetes sp.]
MGDTTEKYSAAELCIFNSIILEVPSLATTMNRGL